MLIETVKPACWVEFYTLKKGEVFFTTDNSVPEICMKIEPLVLLGDDDGDIPISAVLLRNGHVLRIGDHVNVIHKPLATLTPG